MPNRNLESVGRSLLDLLVDRGLLRLWPRDDQNGWTLRSGLWSPFYVDLRGLCGVSDSRAVLESVGDAFTLMIREQMPGTSRLVAVATAGIPIATATTMRSGIPSCYTRTQLKHGDGAIPSAYGEPKFLDGVVSDGDRLVVVDDLITDGSSKIEALNAIRKEAERRGIRLDCRDVAVIMDRGQVGDQRLAPFGVRLHSLIPLRSRGMDWLDGKFGREDLRMMREYLADPAPFQDKEFRAREAARFTAAR
jgi:orotate phosphoribosyltransferase